MKLVRMNTHEYEASANDFIPSSGMEGSAGWAGAWVQKKPRLRMLLPTADSVRFAGHPYLMIMAHDDSIPICSVEQQ